MVQGRLTNELGQRLRIDIEQSGGEIIVKWYSGMIMVAVVLLLAVVLGFAPATIGAELDDALPPPPPTAAPTAAPAAQAEPAATPAAPAAAPAVEAAPKPQVEVVGPLEVSAVKATARASRINASTCIGANLRLRMKNASSSDVKVALLLPDFGATDDLGLTLLASDRRYVKVSGATFFGSAPRNGWVIFLGENAGNLTTLSPGQTVEVQMAPSNPADWRALSCTVDPTSDMMKTYRPTSYSLSGSLGIVDIDGNAQVRSFSLLDVPLQATIAR
jgi:hypothetical protein